MGFKQIYPCHSRPWTSKERKHFAFRKCVEFHLKIPLHLVSQQNHRYCIHKFHWPIVLIQMKIASTSLLNANCIKYIEDQQGQLFGIPNESLRESCNTNGNLVRDFLAETGMNLSSHETLELDMQVQALVASRDDIMAYIETISLERTMQLATTMRDVQPS